MDSKINDGGAAFPHAGCFSINNMTQRAEKIVEPQGGMTLRDYFASKAMQEQIGFEGMEGCDKQNIAAMAYEVADAMIAEREKQK